jgi:hypothetical protein
LTFVLATRQDARHMSKDAAWRALERQLGAKPPRGLRALSAEEIEDLATALGDARHRQTAALAEAGERALNRIPRLLRGPIRKVVG